MSERKIQDVDAEEFFVRDRELDCANDVCGVALPILVEDAQANQPRVGRDADELARDQARDMRAVTVRVEGRHGADIAVREVVERRDAIVEVGPGLDTRIDDRHTDAGAAAGLRMHLERGVVDRLVVEFPVGVNVRRPDGHRREKLFLEPAGRLAFALAACDGSGRSLQCLPRVNQRLLRVQRRCLRAHRVRARRFQDTLRGVGHGLRFGQLRLGCQDRRCLRQTGQAIREDKRALGAIHLRVRKCCCLFCGTKVPLRFERLCLGRNEHGTRGRYRGLGIAGQVLPRDRPVQRNRPGRIESGQSRKVFAMHVGRDRLERGKLALYDVAMRGERIAKRLPVSRFGCDDDRLGSYTPTLERLPKRLVELRISRPIAHRRRREQIRAATPRAIAICRKRTSRVVMRQPLEQTGGQCDHEPYRAA